MRIGLIGCGRMGSALARAIGRVGGQELLLSDRRPELAAGLADEGCGTVAASRRIAEECEYILLGVKPGDIDSLLGELAPLLHRGTVLVSMAAGVSLGKMADIIPEGKFIRLIPSTSVAYGRGILLVARGNSVDDRELSGLFSLLEGMGLPALIPEEQMDAATAVSASGPAFVYDFIEALADGGVEVGLSRSQALEYAAETVLGAALTLLESGRSTASLMADVCSPGGCTADGVAILRARDLRGTVSEAVRASYLGVLRLGEGK